MESTAAKSAMMRVAEVQLGLGGEYLVKKGKVEHGSPGLVYSTHYSSSRNPDLQNSSIQDLRRTTSAPSPFFETELDLIASLKCSHGRHQPGRSSLGVSADSECSSPSTPYNDCRQNIRRGKSRCGTSQLAKKLEGEGALRDKPRLGLTRRCILKTTPKGSARNSPRVLRRCITEYKEACRPEAMDEARIRIKQAAWDVVEAQQRHFAVTYAIPNLDPLTNSCNTSGRNSSHHLDADFEIDDEESGRKKLGSQQEAKTMRSALRRPRTCGFATFFSRFNFGRPKKKIVT